VDVSVRHFKSKYRHPNPVAWKSAFNSGSDFFGKEDHPGQIFIIQVKNIVGFLLRNNKSMSGFKRINVKKSEIVFILGYLVARYFAINDPGENRCHILIKLKLK
jgi:hypothetical protein